MKTLQVLKVRQPIGEFYIGAIGSDDLLDISTVDIRRFQEGKPGTIDGIQRERSKSRLKELSEYVNLPYATFPTSVILAVDERCASLRQVAGCSGLYELEVSAYAGDPDAEISPIPISSAAFVIDGQHRLAGLEKRDRSLGPFDVNVSIFVGADIADQAEIFSRVNLAQTKVNKSLMYDLLDYAKENSPYRVAHELAIAMNEDRNGPLYKKIKRLGVQTPGIDGETLAQATVVEGILRHLPKNQEKERTRSFFGRIINEDPSDNWRERIFINYYRNDDLVAILIILSNYFSAVRRRWPDAWNNTEEGQILSRTTGYSALIRFLKDAYLLLLEGKNKPEVVSEEEFHALLERVEISDDEFNKDNYVPGSSGSGKLYRQLVTQTRPIKLDQQGNLF